MKRSAILRILVVVLSAGWLVPVWLGIDTYLTFWQIEGWPLLLGKPNGNSFEFLGFAKSCIGVGVAWLGLALCFWAYVGFSAWASRREA
jgi:hypothetical protein